MAFYLFQDESNHSFVRAQILEFERINERQFTKFPIPPVNKPNFKGHLEFLQQPMSWATQAKVVTVATFLKYIPVYNFTNSNNYFHWEIIKPMQGRVTSKELFYNLKKPPHHLEFLYWDNTHYNCVATQDGDLCNSDTFLELTRNNSFIDIT